MPLADPPRVPSLTGDSPLLRGAAPQWVGPLYSAAAALGDFFRVPGADRVFDGTLLGALRSCQWMKRRFGLAHLIPA
eukprot:2758436-Lingulodinium_polyedra.AAC.1